MSMHEETLGSHSHLGLLCMVQKCAKATMGAVPLLLNCKCLCVCAAGYYCVCC